MSWLAVLTVLITLLLLMSGRASPLFTFIAVPLSAAVIAGFSIDQILGFVSHGMSIVAPIVALFIFAILFFSTMNEQGLFDPLVNWVVRFAGSSPSLVMIATVVVAAICHLDGAGATTYVITITAFLPIYRRIGINTLHLPMLTGMSAGIMNMLPWTAATLRAASVIKMDPVALWRPLAIPQAVGILIVVCIAWWIGKRETLHPIEATTPVTITAVAAEVDEANKTGKTASAKKMIGWRYFFNFSLTLAVILTLLFFPYIPSVLVFMVGLALSLLVNYRSAGAQMVMVKRHSAEALLLATVLLCAGVFLGVITKSGMLDQLSLQLVAVLPASAARYLHLYLGVLATPIGMGVGSDSYYFGILPLLVKVMAPFGISPETVARAMMIGENVGFAISPMIASAYLAAGLAEVDFGHHIRHAFLRTWLVALAVLLVSVLCGAVQI
ncbi:CitMHS family citrate-Mg2+:H+ or citrate-Ca2+:H+ symporter [Herbaspirillum sp. Sphag1AN]|uniref:CitMHS family transporter n=1 Tax=unclassified Herbaspirillum TaxID=2624150 RepID=UPI001611FA09|nr:MULTISPECIES: SLC13 family permease [unclassified Herbaspirillum]MBB3212750.1 CitMHS family citrate-Mg2+:H+ or citrate-Ca2+:H+ symporter [Herbaspirillum sp. Sphag1AN]MBB3245947.1 CitMHS family citrate-Mg2+:H+ or citrate-Ca2+:H+ symporter [Herbaspirillum sp. Sphag64]